MDQPPITHKLQPKENITQEQNRAIDIPDGPGIWIPITLYPSASGATTTMKARGHNQYCTGIEGPQDCYCAYAAQNTADNQGLRQGWTTINQVGPSDIYL